MKYDYLIVGAGLYGAAFAQQMTAAGKRCLVIDRRPHLAGNAHCQEVEGILVHAYGAHISTLPTRRSGSTSTAMVSSTTTSTPRWPSTTTSCTTSPLT